MQHLEICLPTTEAFFYFSYVLKLSCSCSAATKLNTTAVKFLLLFFQTELFLWFFGEESVVRQMATSVTVHAGS